MWKEEECRETWTLYRKLFGGNAWMADDIT